MSLILGFSIQAQAQKENLPHLLPMPQQIAWHSGICPASFRSISGDDETGLVVDWLDAIGLKQNIVNENGIPVSTFKVEVGCKDNRKQKNQKHFRN